MFLCVPTRQMRAVSEKRRDRGGVSSLWHQCCLLRGCQGVEEFLQLEKL